MFHIESKKECGNWFPILQTLIYSRLSQNKKVFHLNTTLKKAFTWLRRTFHKIWGTKMRLDDAVFDSWSEWKGQKGWKAQCEHPSLHWKREVGCTFYLNCCLLLFFFGENMQDNMKTKFQQLLATLFPRPWKNMFFCQTKFLRFPWYYSSLNTMRFLMVTNVR